MFIFYYYYVMKQCLISPRRLDIYYYYYYFYYTIYVKFMYVLVTLINDYLLTYLHTDWANQQLILLILQQLTRTRT